MSRLGIGGVQLICAFAASALGCGGGSVVTITTTPDSSHAAAGESHDALDTRVAELTTSLRRAGGTPAGIATRGFLAGGESATFPVTVAAGTCLTVATVASPGVRDLDATLFAPSGDVLAEDTAEDAHPSLQLCAPGTAARRAFVVVRAYSGAGAYLATSVSSSRAALPALAGVVGGTPGIASDTIEEVADDARLRDQVLGATRRGLEQRGEPRDVTLAARQTVWLPLPLEASHCVSVVALAEHGLEDVDAQLLDADGSELTRDVGTGRDAGLQHCVERAAELVLVLTAVRGEGNARVVVFDGPVTRVGGASGLWLGQPAADRAEIASLDAVIADAHARATAAGFRVRGRPVRAILPRGGAIRSTLAIAAGTCARLEVSAGPGIARPYLLASVDGVPRAEHEGRGEGQPAIAHLCTRPALHLDISLVARSGSGELALTVSTRATLAAADDVARAEAGRLDELARSLAAGYASRAPARLAAGDSAPLHLTVAAGTCARVVFVADDARRVALAATGSEGYTLAGDSGDAPRVGFCATRGSPRAVDVRASSASAGSALAGTWLVSEKAPVVATH